MARFTDLPIELVEAIADAVAQLPPEPSRLGLSFRNPITGRPFAASSDPLLAFSKTSRGCRLACIRHAPQLVSTLHIRSLQDLHNLRTQQSARTRVAPYVRHLVLDFTLPLQHPDRVKLAMSVLCQVPGLTTLPKLAGLSLSSRFLASFLAHVNHQRVTRDWQEVADQMANWQGKMLAGLASLGSLLSRGGQAFERFGDVEVLFLTGSWSAEQNEILQKHDPPPIPVLSSRNSIHLLITTFPPSSPGAPAVAHPVILATHYLANQLVSADPSYTATPLRPFEAAERASQAADALRPFDEELESRGRRRSWMFDQLTTQTVARAFVEKVCFQPVEPQVADLLPALQASS